MFVTYDQKSSLEDAAVIYFRRYIRYDVYRLYDSGCAQKALNELHLALAPLRPALRCYIDQKQQELERWFDPIEDLRRRIKATLENLFEECKNKNRSVWDFCQWTLACDSYAEREVYLWVNEIVAAAKAADAK